MNEELKIIIKAVTDEAKKNLAGVKEELGKIEDEGKKSGKSITETMKTIGKGVAVAVGAITALTTAMIAVTKSSMEFQKSYGKLISGFQASGSTVQQATKTYSELFRFLGEADTATEASNLLVKLTNDSENLAEWSSILQGVYATFPDSLPIEALAEAANETARTGIVTGNLADALNWAGVSEDAMNAKLATTNSLQEREAILRGTLNSLYGGAASIYERNNQAMLAYNESQVKVDIALANATRYVIPLMTQLNNLAATILQVLKPAFETISAVVIVFVQWIVAAIQYIGTFFGLFGDEGTKATKTVNKNIQDIRTNTAGLVSGVSGLGEGFNQAARAAEKLKKQTMGFDELNVVSSQTSTSTGGSAGGYAPGTGGGGGGVNIPPLADMDLELPGMGDFQQKIADIKEKMEAIAVLAGIVLGVLALWKIGTFISSLKDAIKYLPVLAGLITQMKKDGYDTTVLTNTKKEMEGIISKAKLIGGTLLIVAGAVLLVKGYTDAWVNGIDWGNFSLILGGIALIVGGLALAFGTIGAVIGVIAGAIAMLVIGFKDLTENGYKLESAIMAILGAAMLLSIANPLLGVITLLVGGFYILWNECEGFREFWINLWDNIKKVAKSVWDWIKENVLEPIKNINKKWIKPVIDKLVEMLKKVIEIIGALFKGLWNLLKDKVLTPIGNGFSKLWTKIKEIFKPVTDFFGDIFGKAYKKIKEKIEPIKTFFSGIWSSIKKTFSNLGTHIGNAISDAVKSGINGVISLIEGTINKAIGLINGAIKLINKLPGVEVEKVKELKLPRLATGGIVTSSTIANIGEAGREAVLPLENNTGWMDMLADRIANRQGTPSRLVLMLDGRELGYATINSINDITRQSGNMPLAFI